MNTAGPGGWPMGKPIRSRIGGDGFSGSHLKGNEGKCWWEEGFRALFDPALFPAAVMGLPLTGRTPQSERSAVVISPHLHQTARTGSHDDQTFQFKTKAYARGLPAPLRCPLFLNALPPRPTACLEPFRAVGRRFAHESAHGLLLPFPIAPAHDHRPTGGPTSFGPLYRSSNRAGALQILSAVGALLIALGLAIQAAGGTPSGRFRSFWFCWFSSPALLFH